MSVVQVQYFAGAAQNIAATTLRSVVGDMSLDDVLSKREHMNEILRVKLDDVTERWGVKVTNVEVREILPPPQVQEAMTRQMSAERTRRAVVTEATGTKQAAITVAEGQKQSAILSAEGDRQAAILRAEGFALALGKIFETARTIDANTMSLQYLEALKQAGRRRRQARVSFRWGVDSAAGAVRHGRILPSDERFRSSRAHRAPSLS